MSKHYGKIVSLLATTCIMVNAETIASPDLNVTQPAKESNAVLKANWYEKEHDNSDDYRLNKHGIHLGLGYSF